MLTPHYRLAYIPTGSYSGGNGQRVINDQRDNLYANIFELLMYSLTADFTGAGYGAIEEESGRPSHQIVRVKSRREEDSPSREDTTPVHIRP
jgi:hypothetical protein